LSFAGTKPMCDNVRMNAEKTSQVGGKRSWLGVLLALLLALGAFFSGLQLDRLVGGEHTGMLSLFAGTPAVSNNADLNEFWKVWQLLDEKFAAGTSTFSLTPEQKIQGAIDGLVAAYGDPYTTYFPPSDAAAFDADISGNFSGVGMEVGMRNNAITVISPLSGTPAEKAGLLAGDVIVAIDGTSTDKMNIDEAVRLIRGPEGSVVTLTMYRVGDLEPKEVKVTRATIEIPTVKTEQKGDTFIITLYSFNAIAETKMQDALKAYVRSGAKKIVLDMRGNPGGYLQSAVSIASYFLPSGKVVLRESFSDDRPEQVYRSQGRTLKEFAPQEMVVLIDGGSASAAEILAGALAQHDYATLIGTDSFGKGSVQELVPLPSGSALKVTIARWLTPDGTSISLKGLTPKIVVERTPEQRIAGEDPQMKAALEYLAGTYVPATTTSTSTNNR
jgi:carboxyl-terminal processing protease